MTTQTMTPEQMAAMWRNDAAALRSQAATADAPSAAVLYATAGQLDKCAAEVLIHMAPAAACTHRCQTGRNCGGCGCPGCGYSNEPEHVAWGRPETDPCERGTVGCSVRHTRDSECQTW